MKTVTSPTRLINSVFVLLTIVSATLVASSALASEVVCRRKFIVLNRSGDRVLTVSADRTKVTGRIGNHDFVMQSLEVNDESQLSFNGTLKSSIPCMTCASGYFQINLVKNENGRFEGTSFAYVMRVNRRGIPEILNSTHMNLICD